MVRVRSARGSRRSSLSLGAIVAAPVFLVGACGRDSSRQPVAPMASLDIPPMRVDAGTKSPLARGDRDAAVMNSAAPTTATLRLGTPQVNGRLAVELVEGVVRESGERFRLCYENGLRVSPTLKGRVTVLFEIGSTGDVVTAIDGGSDLADPGVTGCVRRVFLGLDFPRPRGGSALVTYPLDFDR